MRKESALALTMIGGLQATTTTWAWVAPLIEAMRQTEVTGKADKRQGLLLPGEAGPLVPRDTQNRPGRDGLKPAS